MSDAELQSLFPNLYVPVLHLRLYTSIAMFLVLLIALVYGAIRITKKSKDYPFAVTAVIGIAALMMGAMFSLVITWTQNSMAGSYNTSLLGTFGGLIFILVANRQCRAQSGASQKRHLGSAIISGIVCLVVCAVILGFLDIPTGNIISKVVYSIEVLLLCGVSFAHLREAIEPSDSALCMKLRPFNFAVFIYAICNAIRIVLWFYIFDSYSISTPIIILTVLSCVSVLAMAPLLERGIK